MVKLCFLKNAPLVKEYSIGTFGCSIGTIFLPFTRFPKLWEDSSPVLLGTGWERESLALLAARQRFRKVAVGDEEALIITEKTQGPSIPSLTHPGPLYSFGVFQWLLFLCSNVALAQTCLSSLPLGYLILLHGSVWLYDSYSLSWL